MTTLTSERIELRCPIGSKALLAVVRRQKGTPKIVDGNLLELPCRDCRALVHATEGRKPLRVLHRFDVIGTLVESEAVWE